MDYSREFDEVLRRTFGQEDLEVTDDLAPADVEGWDSVGHINLMFAVEQSFGIQFAGNEFGEFENVGDLKRLIARKLGVSHPEPTGRS